MAVRPEHGIMINIASICNIVYITLLVSLDSKVTMNIQQIPWNQTLVFARVLICSPTAGL